MQKIFIIFPNFAVTNLTKMEFDVEELKKALIEKCESEGILYAMVAIDRRTKEVILPDTIEVRFEEKDSHLLTGLLSEDIMDKDEKLFQSMWKEYFKSIAIKERLNLRLHRQHMPARFWKYMPEKR